MRKLFWVVWVCGTQFVLATGAQTNDVVSAVLTNFSPAISTNDVVVEVTNTVPEVAVEVVPVSAELGALFEALEAESAASAETARKILIRSLSEGQAGAGAERLYRYLSGRAGSLNWADPLAVEDLISATCCVRALEALDSSNLSGEVWNWLFESPERVRLVSETVTEYDNAPAVAEIFQMLYRHDPEGRDRFLNLILAMAVVWDTPRKEMHKQIGEGWLPPDEDVSVYYDYFKKLYSSSKAKVRYSELSVDSLVFVVDVPAPVRELEWALKNVKGVRAKWGDHYAKITYDITRLVKGRYDWPHRDYTLQEIEECHGICVDQAYYCVITARAHGIPSLYFHGKGKYGGHAWFGFMKRKTEWDLEVGRYSKQGYATGFSIHPQTDEEMTDHELEYYCSRALRSEAYRNASAMVHLAGILHAEGNTEQALVCVQRARALEPFCEEAWELEYDILIQLKDEKAAMDVLRKKAVRFKEYEDIAADARRRQASLLVQAGNGDRAARLLGKEVALVDSDRDDLQQELVMAQAEQLLAQGDAKKGLRVIERVLREQRNGGAKLRPLMEEYTAFAKKTGQLSDALDFLRSYGK